MTSAGTCDRPLPGVDVAPEDGVSDSGLSALDSGVMVTELVLVSLLGVTGALVDVGAAGTRSWEVDVAGAGSGVLSTTTGLK
ncbi:hypothetical protein [Rhodococcus sp. 27YEA15]|uniref:hypothetical protein n=1 Tax=Rhodococcus sp. 27YEA15 TaxID=3156259 RepID=UPI003C7DDADA